MVIKMGRLQISIHSMIPIRKEQGVFADTIALPIMISWDRNFNHTIVFAIQILFTQIAFYYTRREKKHA